MLPRELNAKQFAGYPPEARGVAGSHIESLRQLPISFLPSLLREVIDYDYKFPMERQAIDKELETLNSLTPDQMREWFQPFEQVNVSQALTEFDWVNRPAQFTEQLSAYLWSTHQLDLFRAAATEYGARLAKAIPPMALPVPRLGIAVIGQGVVSYDGALFKNLRPHGTYFNEIKPENGFTTLLDAAGARAKAHPTPYGHWYVDGGEAADHSTPLTCVSYKGMEPMRRALLKKIQEEIAQPGMGPEELRTRMAEMTPAAIGMGNAGDAVLDRFQLRLLTEGSGTQIYSTTFAQWTTREALRRAQALTMIVRFAPRQTQKPLNELLSNTHGTPDLDATGSLVDADMAAYYHWINQQRLPGDAQSIFVAWFEDRNQAMVISPTLPRGVTSSSAIGLGELLKIAVS